MRIPLLALPAVLSAFVVASPAVYLQQSLDALPPPPPPPQPRKSLWSSLSDRLIESIWGQPPSSKLKEGGLPPQELARYGGDLVLRFNISTVDEAQSLAEAANSQLLDIWDFSHDFVDIRLSKSKLRTVLGLLPVSLQNAHTPLLQERDLTNAISNTFPTREHPFTPSELVQSRHFRLSTDSDILSEDVHSNVFFQEYRSLSVIESWMRFLAEIFESHVSLINIGQSYENRPIRGLRVGFHPTPADGQKRKTVLVTGGLHAREWISVSTVSYIAYNLITSYGNNVGITKLLQEYDFIFIPTVNPDGYVYTWETDRLWRKNRQRTTLRFCQGIDLDHGFGFEWDGVSTAGNPCSESYAGTSAFEAVESRRLADWARNETERNNVEFVSFLDLHSYSQQILYPYSYSCEDTPPSQENLEELAVGLEKAIRRSSSLSYESMPACAGNMIANQDGGKRFLPRMEGSGGSALDWFYHELHVHYAYQVKLRDRGTYGFLLPRENIVPTGKEMLEAVLYLGEFLREGYPKQLVDKASASSSKDALATEDVDNGWVFVEKEEVEDEEEAEWEWELRRRRRR